MTQPSPLQATVKPGIPPLASTRTGVVPDVPVRPRGARMPDHDRIAVNPAPLEAEAKPVIRYSQVWEDETLLLEALTSDPGGRFLSIGSAGDNALALLLLDPAEILVVDHEPAQIACLELRLAAYRCLDYPAFLELYGAQPSQRREALYMACRPCLSPAARECWEQRRDSLFRHGFGAVGRLEDYFRLFRRRLLPLVQDRATLAALFEPRDPEGRARFFSERWNSWRWRLLFRLFFSRPIMGLLGRERDHFAHADESLGNHLSRRLHHALVSMDPSANPWLRHILCGAHTLARAVPDHCLPTALQPAAFATIRTRLDRITLRQASLDQVLDQTASAGDSRALFDAANLSDVFEYMDPGAFQACLTRLHTACRSGARIAFWNMLVRREIGPEDRRWRHLESLSNRLHARDRAFFYCAFHVAEALP